MSLISSRLDFKSYLKGSIWYHSESLEVLYSGPRAVSYSKPALVKSFPKYLPIFHLISTVLNVFMKDLKTNHGSYLSNHLGWVFLSISFCSFPLVFDSII